MLMLSLLSIFERKGLLLQVIIRPDMEEKDKIFTLYEVISTLVHFSTFKTLRILSSALEISIRKYF